MAHLPPKVPSMAPSPNWPDFSHPKLENNNSTSSLAAAAMNCPASWVDEFLDFSSTRRGSHRRSMSDSVTFLEPPAVRRSTVPAGGDGGGSNTNHHHGSMIMNHMINHEHQLEVRFDDEQLLISLFADGVAAGPTMSCSNPPSSPSSDHNSMNEDDDHKQLMCGTSDQLQELQLHPKSEPEEVEISSPCKSEGLSNGIHHATSDNSSEKIVDPKRIKRVLANRQSAQRSRVRKLQYISELERSVTSLQAEVSVLSPRVAFLDHQRLVLNVDNSVLKQRIAALAQDKVFKDAHQEALKREMERLRQMYYEQNLEKMEADGGLGSKSPSRLLQPAVLDANCSADKEQPAI